ncbi:SRPBCC domain-containing protein [Intrasporangium flavum]|uniref:SRPBCC domain-containing protein n=1 Tax=Intrasporangium flavum TaxID=1428657 RepID=UPI00096D919F|nr:SRPBCC domain-containing protein [Intrasporangium flavum]
MRHDSFTLTRTLPVAPSAVWAAFADDSIRRRWMRMPGSGARFEHDFRVGGGERASASFTTLDHPTELLENESHYLELVPARRLVFAYRATVDGVVRWASLVMVELEPTTGESGVEATELTWTEQVVLLVPSEDGGSVDLAHLRGGIQLRLNALALAVAPG